MLTGSNILIIVLILVLVLCLYWLYKFAIQNIKTPLEKINLASTTSVPDENSSAVCYYSGWIYVNSWTAGIKTILKKGVNTPPTCHLYLNTTTPELICETDTIIDASTGVKSAQKTILQRSFPLQSWTHILLGFDGNVMDYYMNGKLVTSVQLRSVISFDRSDILLGGSGGDIYMSGFIKKADRATADRAMSEFNSSKSVLRQEIPDYKLKMTLLKDGEVAKKITLF